MGNFKNLMHLIEEWCEGGEEMFTEIVKLKLNNNLVYIDPNSIWHKPPSYKDFNAEFKYFDNINDYLIYEKTGAGNPSVGHIYPEDFNRFVTARKREELLNKLLK